MSKFLSARATRGSPVLFSLHRLCLLSAFPFCRLPWSVRTFVILVACGRPAADGVNLYAMNFLSKASTCTSNSARSSTNSSLLPSNPSHIKASSVFLVWSFLRLQLCAILKTCSRKFLFARNFHFTNRVHIMCIDIWYHYHDYVLLNKVIIRILQSTCTC